MFRTLCMVVVVVLVLRLLGYEDRLQIVDRELDSPTGTNPSTIHKLDAGNESRY